MRILINGLQLFGKRLAADLSAAEPSSSFIFCNTYTSVFDRLRFMLLLPFSDAVISMNGVSDRSGSLEAVIRMKKKLILQWMGTDALLAMERMKDGTIVRRYIDYAYNWVDSPWLKDEVGSLGVETNSVFFKSVPQQEPVLTFGSLNAMSYIAQKRQKFYGLEHILTLAKAFPDIEFNIYGMSSSDYPLPENVLIHGWVKPEEFRDKLKQSAIFVRLTEHEGFPVSVIEAMSYGCEVMMSMPYSPVVLARTADEAVSGFERIIQKLRERGMKPNQELVEIARRDFDKDKVVNAYLKALKSVVQS
jgi:glycosyltransferase involved in cell wall biosynthesis